MDTQNSYQHLEHRPWANSKQMYVKDRRKLKAYDLYTCTVGEDARTPQQTAEDWEVPVEAVLESIDYCEKNKDLIRKEIDEDWAAIRQMIKENKILLPPDYVPDP